MASGDGASHGLRTRDQFERQFESDKTWAAQSLTNSGSVSLMHVVHGRDGDVVPLVDAGGDAGREALTELTRLVAVGLDAVALASMGEVWLVLHPETAMIRTSQSDRRQEALVVGL